MGMRRSTLRKHVFSALFRVEFHNEDDFKEQLGLYCSELEDATTGDVEYIVDRTSDILNEIPALDEKLTELSEGWDVSRIGKVELTILRLALYEIIYDESIPNPVAVNEAVELAKAYGGDNSYSFVNGVLSKVLA